MTVDPFIPYTDAGQGAPSWRDVVAAAEQYIGASWAADNCTGLVWAIATEVASPFYETILTATGGASSTMPAVIPDNGYTVPPQQPVAGTTAAWETLPATSDWRVVVQPGDLVRIPASVFANDPKAPKGHSFVVVGQDADGNWLVIDNTDPTHVDGSDAPITISEPHTFKVPNKLYSEILGASTAYITRLVSASTPPPSFAISNAGDVTAGDQAVFSVTMTGNITAPVTIWYSTIPGTASAADGDYAGTYVNQPLTFTPGRPTTQQIDIPTLTHPGSAMESPETFSVGLRTSETGSAFTTAGATIEPNNPSPPAVVDSITTSPTTGTLGVGSVVTFTLNLSAPVTVDGGTPMLLLNDGGAASYTGGSGTDALTFSYTVAAGQNTADLKVTELTVDGAAMFAPPAGLTLTFWRVSANRYPPQSVPPHLRPFVRGLGRRHQR